MCVCYLLSNHIQLMATRVFKVSEIFKKWRNMQIIITCSFFTHELQIPNINIILFLKNAVIRLGTSLHLQDRQTNTNRHKYKHKHSKRTYWKKCTIIIFFKIFLKINLKLSSFKKTQILHLQYYNFGHNYIFAPSVLQFWLQWLLLWYFKITWNENFFFFAVHR